MNEEYVSKYLTGQDIDNALDNATTAVQPEDLEDIVGNLEDLTTTDKSNIVSAINEVNENADELKEDLSEFTGCIRIKRTEHGKYVNTSLDVVDITNFVQSSSSDCWVIPCNPEDVFTVTGTGATAARLWCFVDNVGNPIDRAESNATENKKVLTSPSGSRYLVVNAKNNVETIGDVIKGNLLQEKIKTIYDKSVENEEDIESLRNYVDEKVDEIVDDYYYTKSSYNRVNLTKLVGSGVYSYWQNNSSNHLSQSSSDTVKYIGYEAIPVLSGEEYKIHARTGTDNYFKAWFVVDINYNVILSAERSADTLMHDYDIVIPNNGSYLCIQDYNAERAELFKKTNVLNPVIDRCIVSGDIVVEDTSEYNDFNDLPLNKIVRILPNAILANRPDGYRYVGHNNDDTGKYDATVITYSTSDINSIVQICTYYNDTYDFSKNPKTATRYGIRNGELISWSDWSVSSMDSCLHSTNRVVDVNSYETWTFGDFNDAPVNTIYQVDLNCADVVLNNPSPGNSGLLMTYAFSPITRHALIQQHYALENGDVTMYIRYSYKNAENDFRWTNWKKVAFVDN